jgi:hypothetical protein
MIKTKMHKPEKVLAKVKSELEKSNLPIPKELEGGML